MTLLGPSDLRKGDCGQMGVSSEPSRALREGEEEANIASEEDLDDEEMASGPESGSTSSVEAPRAGQRVQTTVATAAPPPAGRLALLSHHFKSNSLKRSITLPRNPFASSKHGASNAANGGQAEEEMDVEDEEDADSRARNNRLNLFNRVVSQWPIASTAAGGRNGIHKQPEINEERLRELRRRMEEGERHDKRPM